MAHPNANVVARWVDSVGRCADMTGGTVLIRSGALLYHRRGRGRSFGPVVLARYIEKPKLILLNGDGFPDQFATASQTRVRITIQNALFHDPTKANGISLVPFAALTAAEIDIDTIRPIEIVPDEIVRINHKVDFDIDSIPDDPEEWLKRLSAPPRPSLEHQSQLRISVRQKGVGFRGMWTRSVGMVHSPTGIRTTSRTVTDEDVWRAAKESERSFESVYRNRHSEWSSSHRFWDPEKRVFWVRAANDPNALTRRDQQSIRYIDDALIPTLPLQLRSENENRISVGREPIRSDLPTEKGWYWSEEVHHLGASVFSAIDVSKKRHDFVSAFDTDEPGRMYFLAQLPDKSGAASYQEAILALAPPLVHRARLEGKTVRRQGDVFAIETSLTDDEVYAMAATRVRRVVVMTEEIGWGSMESLQKWWKNATPAPGEVRERIVCPCGCGHRAWYGCGPKAKRALMIYGTGHTANEVVKTASGTTYIKGVMHHDPQLEDPSRIREHADVVLGQSWFLAVRNTVPRRRVRSRQREEVTTT